MTLSDPLAADESPFAVVREADRTTVTVKRSRFGLLLVAGGLAFIAFVTTQLGPGGVLPRNVGQADPVADAIGLGAKTALVYSLGVAFALVGVALLHQTVVRFEFDRGRIVRGRREWTIEDVRDLQWSVLTTSSGDSPPHSYHITGRVDLVLDEKTRLLFAAGCTREEAAAMGREIAAVRKRFRLDDPDRTLGRRADRVTLKRSTGIGTLLLAAILLVGPAFYVGQAVETVNRFRRRGWEAVGLFDGVFYVVLGTLMLLTTLVAVVLLASAEVRSLVLDRERRELRSFKLGLLGLQRLRLPFDTISQADVVGWPRVVRVHGRDPKTGAAASWPITNAQGFVSTEAEVQRIVRRLREELDLPDPNHQVRP